MRKVRDFDAELKTLNERAKLLRSRKIQQFGELIEATGADALEPDLLAGALLSVVEEKDNATTMAWSEAGRGSFGKRAGDPRAALLVAVPPGIYARYARGDRHRRHANRCKQRPAPFDPVMIDDREVWASASHVLGTYGDHANMFIGSRIRNLAMAGDQADIAMWRMIADRLDALRDGQGAGEAHH